MVSKLGKRTNEDKQAKLKQNGQPAAPSARSQTHKSLLPSWVPMFLSRCNRGLELIIVVVAATGLSTISLNCRYLPSLRTGPLHTYEKHLLVLFATSCALAFVAFLTLSRLFSFSPTSTLSGDCVSRVPDTREQTTGKVGLQFRRRQEEVPDIVRHKQPVEISLKETKLEEELWPQHDSKDSKYHEVFIAEKNCGRAVDTDGSEKDMQDSSQELLQTRPHGQ